MSRKRGRHQVPRPSDPPVVQEADAPSRFWTLYALALGLRLVHLVWHRADFWLTVPLLDDAIFESWADTILKEGWLAPSLGVFDFNPAYPYFLAAVRAVIGPSQHALFVLQHALGALVAPLLYRVTARAFDRRAAMAAGLLAAAYGPALFFESRLLGEWCMLLASASTLWLIGRASFSRRRWLWWGLGGLCLGASAALRPTALLFAPLAALGCLWHLRREPAVIVRCLAAFALGLWLPLLPFQVRNRLVVPEAGWGLTTSSGGVNLYLGNNPEADGLNQPPSFVRYGPGHEYQDFAEEAGRRLGRPLSRAEVSRYWTGRVLEFWGREPGRAAALFVRKAGYFWNHAEPPDNFFLEIFRRFTRLGPVPLVSWGFISAFGLAGLLWSLRGATRFWMLHAFVLAQFLVCVLFYVLARYRFPAAAGLIPFAGLALSRLYDYAAARSWTKAGALAALCLVTAGFSRLPLIGGEDPGVSHYSMAVVYANRGWRDKALEEYRASVSADPSFKASWLNMGLMLAEQGRGAEAADALERAGALESDPARRALIGENVRRLRGAR
ncbi:MAG: glycosyltransferase family 39 protein [Elusimicrobia bacterium]|nr:glycosyltransferase family 39 protein [Elusimicrobiota bacterium]